ncbi:MAG: hypothetical protein J0I18_15420 [Actinobacteria bacterium]|nr:hypothetical protein [Actinomycetota bacterium]
MIDLSIHDGIARITLNAPERLNALGPDGLRALDAAYAEAVAGGLFSRALPADALEGAVSEAAAAAASGATQAFLASKRIVAGLRDGDLDFWSSVAAETEAQVALRDTADYREGFAAFQQKRRPVFRGR